jgi:hypothetical protein
MGTAEGNITTLTEDLGKLEETVQGIIDIGGQPNVIEKVSVGGTDLTPDSAKRVKLGKFAAESKTTISYSDFDTEFQNRITTDETNITNL